MAAEIAYPELNAGGRYWDAVGYVFPPQEIDGGGAAFVRYVGTSRPRGVPEIAANLNPFAYTFFRPLVRGREIHVLATS